jgi:hypothetical protein
MLNRKSDDRRFEINGRYVHIYENLVEVTIDDVVQYEGELHVLETDLKESVINSNLDTMIAMLHKIREQGRSCAHTKDIARVYLEATDYLARKCIEKSVKFSVHYPEVKALSDIARTIVNNGWQ